MGEVIHTVDVDVDLQTAYNQWTQFEEFPRFMEGVEEVKQLDDRRLQWTVDIAGIEREFEAEITEQNPDERIAWKSTSGVDHAGVVTFHRLNDWQTRVSLQMAFDPEGFIEHAGDKLGVVSSRVRGDLDRFKTFIEERQVETGAWRGEIDRKDEGSHIRNDDTQELEGTPAVDAHVEERYARNPYAELEELNDRPDDARRVDDLQEGFDEGLRRFGG